MIRSDQADNEYVFEELLKVARSEDFKAFTNEEKEFTLQCLKNKRYYLEVLYPESYVLEIDVSDLLPG